MLFFWADWCSFCRELIPVMDELADKYSESIKIVTISADFNKKASKSFEIKAVPHVVYFKNGEKTGSLTGKRTKEEIENFIRTGIDKKAGEMEKNLGKGSVCLRNCFSKLLFFQPEYLVI